MSSSRCHQQSHPCICCAARNSTWSISHFHTKTTYKFQIQVIHSYFQICNHFQVWQALVEVLVNDWFVRPQLDCVDLFTQMLSVFKKFLHSDEVELFFFFQKLHVAMQVSQVFHQFHLPKVQRVLLLP